MANDNTNNNKQSFDSLLKCALCNNNLIKNNQPKTLPCLHTFCSPCLTHKRRSFVQDDNIFKCPACHSRVELSPEDPEITNNLKLDVIIEKLLHVRQLLQSNRYCEMCNEMAVSKQWCLDCGVFLCDSCLADHARYKPHDKVIDVSQGVDFEKVGDFILPTKCSDHGEKLHTFCAHCEICLCSVCILEHRSDKNCSVLASIEKTAPDTKSQGRQLLEEMSSHLEKEKQQIEGMKLAIDSVNSQYTGTCDVICKRTEEVVNILKEHAQTFIVELETKAKNETNAIQEMIQRKQDHIKKIEITNDSLYQLLQHFDNINIFMNFPRLKHKCSNLLTEFHPVEDVSCKSRMKLEYNIWYEKMRQIWEDFSSEKLWIEAVRNNTPQLTLIDESAQNNGTTHTLAPVPKLLDSERKISLGELTKEMKKLYSCDRCISGIFVCDENYVWVCDDSLNELSVFSAEDKLLAVGKPNDMQRPRDLCLLSSETVGVVDGNLVLFEREKDAPFFKLSKQVTTEVEYVSICNCFGKILACDSNCRVYLLTAEGTVLKNVVDILREESPYHRISSGPYVDTFLLLDYKSDKLYCYSLFDSKLIFTHKTERLTSDTCTDKYGNIYVVNGDEIYSLNAVTLQKHHLFPIGGGLIWPRIFIKNDTLYLTLNTLRHPYDTSGKCEVKIMSISY